MASPRILLVTEKPGSCERIRERLEVLGYRVEGPDVPDQPALSRSRSLEPPGLALIEISDDYPVPLATAISIRARFQIPMIFLFSDAGDECLRNARQASPEGLLRDDATNQELQFAIESALTRHRADRDVERFTELSDLVSAVNRVAWSAENPAYVFPEVCRMLVQKGSADLAWVERCDLDSEGARPVASFGENADELERVGLPRAGDDQGPGTPGDLIQKGQPLLCGDKGPCTYRHDVPPVLAALGFRSCACLPICLHGKTWGFLGLASKTTPCPQDWESQLLETVTGILSLFLEQPSGRSAREQATTERKRVESAFTEREQQLQLFIEHSPAAIAMLDYDLRYLAYSQRWLSDYRLSQSDLLGLHHFEIFPDIPEHWKEAHRRCLAGATERSEGESFVRSDGSIDWVRWEIRPWYTHQGTIGGLIVFSELITNRKLSEERLQKVIRIQNSLHIPGTLREKLKRITDGVVDIFGADFARIWLIGPGDKCSSGCTHADPPEAKHRCEFHEKCLYLMASSGRYEHLDGRMHNRVPFGLYKIGRIASGMETSFLTNDVVNDVRIHDPSWARELGLVSFCGYQLRPADGEPIGVMALFSKRPISSEEDILLKSLSNMIVPLIQTFQAEESLRESEARYRLISENTGDVIWLYDIALGRFTYVSPSVEKLRGFTVSEVLGQGFEEALTPEFYALVEDLLPLRIAAFTAGDKTAQTQTHEMVQTCKDGSTVLTEVVTTLIADRHGRITHIQGVTRDITERKRAERALQESEQRFRAYLDQAPDSLLAHDQFGRIVDVNRACCESLGYSRSELLQMNVADIEVMFQPAEPEHLWLGAGQSRSLTVEARSKRKDGTTFPVEVRLTAFELNGLPHFLAIARDTTERRKAEERSRQLRDLGFSLASVSHLGEALELCLQTALEISGADAGGVYLLNESTNELNLACHRGLSAQFVKATARYDEDSPNLKWAWQGLPFHGSFDDTGIPHPQIQQEEGLKAGSLLPILQNGRPIALLNVASRTQTELQPAARLLLEAVAHLLGDVIQRLRTQESLMASERLQKLALQIGDIGTFEINLASSRHSWSQEVAEFWGIPEGFSGDFLQFFWDHIHPEDLLLTRQLFEHIVHSRKEGELEFRIVRDDGATRWIRWRGQTLLDDSGAPQRIVGVNLDITEVKEQEASFRENQRRLSALLVNLPGIAYRFRHDSNWSTEFLSEGCLDLTGYSAAELKAGAPLHYRDLILPEDREPAAETVRTGVEQHRKYQLLYRIRTATGAIKWVWEQGTGVYSPAGEALASEGFIMDFTAHKAAEELLSRYRLLSDYARDIILFVRPEDGKILEANQAACQTYGYTRDELLAMTVFDFHSADTQEDLTAQMQRALQEGLLFEACHRCRDGRLIPVEVSARGAALEGETCLLSVVRDISERKRTEQALLDQRDLGLKLLSTDSLEEGVQRCMATALRISGMDCAGMHLVEEDGGLRLAAHQGISERFRQAIAYFPPDSRQARWSQLGRAFHGRLETFELRETHSAVEGLRSASLLPILRGGRQLAVLSLGSYLDREIPFTLRHLLESIANQTGTFIERTQAQAALQAAWEELEERVVQRTAELSREIEDRITAERQLRDREERHRDLVNTVPDWVWEIDASGKYTFCGPQCVDFFSYQPEDLIGRTPFDLMDSEEAERVMQVVGPAMSRGEPIRSVENVARKKDGSTIILETSGVPIRDEGGNLKGYRGLDRNITERKKAEGRIRTLGSAVEQSPTAVVITSGSGTIEYVNPRFEEQTGFSAEECLGHNPRILKSGLHPPEFYKEMWATINSGKVWRGELCNRHKNGTLFWESTAIAPVWDESGLLSHYVATKEDTTERRRIAEELKAAKEAADAANLAKSRFLANMSHEIRTPMNAILGFTQLLKRDPDLNAKQRKQLETVNTSGEHLLRLINDILDMSKIEAGRMQLSTAEFDFNSLIEETVAVFRQKAEEKRLSFALERDPGLPSHLLADSDKIRQVLINVLGNAIRFTTHGGIRVRVAPAPAPGGPRVLPVEIEVIDTGSGIAEEELHLVFEPFEQTESGRQKGGGTGLGMAISRQLARMLGGDLTVSSQAGVGSAFKFVFVAEVLGREARPRTLEPPHRVIGLKPGTPHPVVLVVDDIESNRSLLRQLLEAAGFVVGEAGEGQEAVQWCQTRTPDLVLMDRRMPDLDGLEATRLIRCGPNGSHPKIIMVSAGVFDAQEREWKPAGIDGFVGKPIQADALLDQIGALLDLELVSEKQPEASPDLRSKLGELVAILPQELRSRLVQVTEAGDIKRLQDLISSEVRGLDRELSQVLSELAANYEYEQILKAMAGFSEEE